MTMEKLLLLTTLAAYSVMGWVLVGGMAPVYVLPLALGYVFALKNRKHLFTNRPMILFSAALGLLATWSAVGLIYSDHKHEPILSTLGWVSSLGLFLYSFISIRSFKDQTSVLKLFCLVHLVGLGLAFSQVYAGIGYFAPSAYRGSASGFEGMTYLFGKNYLPLFAFSAAALALRPMGENLLGKPFVITMAIVGYIGVIFSDSRSTILGLVIGLICLPLLVRNKRTAIICVALIISTLVLASTSSKWHKPTLYDIGASSQKADMSLSIRLMLWEAAGRIVQDKPFTGVGGGNFRHVVREYLPPESAQTLQVVFRDLKLDPHNVFLGVAAGHGIPGLLLFVLILGFTILLAFRRFRDSNRNETERLASLAILLYLCMYVVDMNFHNYFDDNNLWVFLGIFYASLSFESDGSSKTSDAGSKREIARIALEVK